MKEMIDMREDIVNIMLVAENWIEDQNVIALDLKTEKIGIARGVRAAALTSPGKL